MTSHKLARWLLQNPDCLIVVNLNPSNPDSITWKVISASINQTLLPKGEPIQVAVIEVEEAP